MICYILVLARVEPLHLHVPYETEHSERKQPMVPHTDTKAAGNPTQRIARRNAFQLNTNNAAKAPICAIRTHSAARDLKAVWLQLPQIKAENLP
jgi:hypothetical protein